MDVASALRGAWRNEVTPLAELDDAIVDPAIRGGFVAKVGDTLIDASLQHQLENLREDWKQAALSHVN